MKLNYYKTDRPNVDSLLHLVGQWLFEAALKSSNDNTKSENENANSLKHNREYVLGQAEAYGILCKIFCSIRTNYPVSFFALFSVLMAYWRTNLESFMIKINLSSPNKGQQSSLSLFPSQPRFLSWKANCSDVRINLEKILNIG